jgi:hypothetical protein
MSDLMRSASTRRALQQQSACASSATSASRRVGIEQLIRVRLLRREDQEDSRGGADRGGGAALSSRWPPRASKTGQWFASPHAADQAQKAPSRVLKPSPSTIMRSTYA